MTNVQHTALLVAAGGLGLLLCKLVPAGLGWLALGFGALVLVIAYLRGEKTP